MGNLNLSFVSCLRFDSFVTDAENSTEQITSADEPISVADFATVSGSSALLNTLTSIGKINNRVYAAAEGDYTWIILNTQKNSHTFSLSKSAAAKRSVNAPRYLRSR